MEVARHYLKSRSATLGAFALFGLVLFSSVLLFSTAEPGWHVFSVPSAKLTFGDTRTITSAIDYLRSGVDPYSPDALDHFGNNYNYPPAWLALEKLGVTQDGSTNIIGSIFLILFFISCVSIFSVRDLFTGAVVFFSILSPAVLLGLERGNCDVFLFSLVALGFFLTGKLPRWPRMVLHCLIVMLLTVLKIYPIAAVIATMRQRKDIIVAALIVAFSVGTLLATSWRELPEVFKYTPTPIHLAYGNLPVFIELSRFQSSPLPPDIAKLRLIADAVTCVIIALTFAAFLRWHRKSVRFFPNLAAGPTGHVALACLGVFCISFCFGSNYAYRLIFLLGLIPPFITRYQQRRSVFDTVAMLAILSVLWMVRGSHALGLVFEPLVWCLFAGACGWIWETLFDRIAGDVVAGQTRPGIEGGVPSPGQGLRAGRRPPGWGRLVVHFIPPAATRLLDASSRSILSYEETARGSSNGRI